MICLSLLAFSQVNDAGLWADISIEKRFNQSFALEYTNSNRLNENISEYETSINELSLKYRFNKKSKIALSYRYSMKRQLNNMYQPGSRFSFEFVQGFEIWDFDLDIRLKYQTQQQNVSLYDYDTDSRNTIRPKIKLKYKFQKFEPYLSLESFHPVWYAEYQPISKLRGACGIGYSVNKNHSIDFAYLVQREFFEKNPTTDYILQLGYKFRF